jgi:hypothetical protein
MDRERHLHYCCVFHKVPKHALVSERLPAVVRMKKDVRHSAQRIVLNPISEGHLDAPSLGHPKRFISDEFEIPLRMDLLRLALPLNLTGWDEVVSNRDICHVNQEP